MAAPEPRSDGARRLPNEPILARLKGLHPRLIDLSLGRIERLLDALGHPELRLPPVVHVAGTNGKGSVVAYLRAIAKAADLRVQSYISPHLVRFNERIVLRDGPIGDDALAAFLAACEAANAGAPITFFEITTAAAFLAFASEAADLLLLETGLGGRLDATNVVARPLLTAITPVSLDHMHYLGDTLSAIAGEKAGILKPGVRGIIGPQPAEAMAVIEARAEAIGVPLHRFGAEWSATATDDGMRFAGRERSLRLPPPALPGAHQIVNAGIAVAAACALAPLGIGEEAIRAGVVEAVWPGRLQRLTRGPLVQNLAPGWEVWLDGGHNPAAGAALATWASSASPEMPMWLVFGMLVTKDPVGFLRPLAALAEGLYAVEIAGEENSLSAAAAAAAARAARIDATTSEGPAAAIAAIVSTARGPGRILICGSLYLAGAVLRENG